MRCSMPFVELFPIVLGSGKCLFANSEDAKRFRWTSTTAIGDGIAVLTYTPVHV